MRRRKHQDATTSVLSLKANAVSKHVNKGHFTEVNFALRVNRNLAVEHNALSSKKL